MLYLQKFSIFFFFSCDVTIHCHYYVNECVSCEAKLALWVCVGRIWVIRAAGPYRCIPVFMPMFTFKTLINIYFCLFKTYIYIYTLKSHLI